MSVWKKILHYFRWVQEPPENPYSIRFALAGAVVENTVDFLYYILGIFTYVYLLAATYLFFFDHSSYHEVFIKIFRALSEPYLGAVGIYVILKEIRKRRLGAPSRHWGEIFVYAWLLLFLVACGFVILLPNFYFDDLMASIVTISLVLGTIYVGGAVNRP